jgi:hypothetical protein
VIVAEKTEVEIHKKVGKKVGVPVNIEKMNKKKSCRDIAAFLIVKNGPFFSP